MIVLQTGHILDFNIGDIVYLIVDQNQLPKIITGISLRPNKTVSYALSDSSNETWHFSIEITLEKQIL